MSNKFLFITLLLGSFLISSLFWFGPIDPDFFYFYHVGKEVALGQKLYVDIGDNKGPVHYFFYTVLYSIFGHNYGWALFIGSTLIDAASLFIIFKLIERDWEYKWKKYKIVNLLIVFFFLLLYKSFSMGSYMGGLYSENVGMLWLSLGIWLLGKKHSVFSGALFALSVLSRLTYLFFAPFFLTLLFFNFKDKHKLTRQFLGFSIGGLLCLGIFILYFWINGELHHFFYNVFGQNSLAARKLAAGIDKLLLTSIVVSLIEPRIIITFMLSLLVVILKIFSKENFKNKAILITLFACSLLTTFTGGLGNIFYYHHFFQFNLMSIIAITQFRIFVKTKEVFLPLIFLLIFFVSLNYYLFLRNGENNVSSLRKVHPNIPEIVNKKYLVVVPYYPIYYVAYDKTAPDKFFQYFFFSSRSLENPEKKIEQHQKLNRQRLQNTAFMFVYQNKFEQDIITEYKNNFGEKFNLKKVNKYRDLDVTIEVYESSKRN